MLMLYLSVLILIPLSYSLIIPIFIKPMIFREALYYWFSYIFYLTVNTIINILTNLYAIFNMEKLKWGKTRQIENIISDINNNEEINSFSSVSSMSQISHDINISPDFLMIK